ncbi:hypothetical protein H5P28_13375 [Ruficoccus amylovorans]|uniref:Uncharacterized protein n=1 Tax=Ruficoccus amylovorans TaxID=1804625 RepID=A0A842HFF6_9BACT|nr:hypothetical protein [Ruficoccus amylovorans]MBC2595253.1 hypothetical protein [Ruficoccus amylovorans]
MKKILLAAFLIAFSSQVFAETLAGWDPEGLSAEKGGWPSPWQPTTVADGVDVVQGLTCGVGVRLATLNDGWGGNGFDTTSAQAAVTTGQYLSFTLSPAKGRELAFSSIAMNIRLVGRSYEPGVVYQWQYRIGNGSYTDIGKPVEISTAKGHEYETKGIAAPELKLDGVSALQSVREPVELRLLAWAATKSRDFSFVFGRLAGDDLVISGSVK